MAVKDCSYGDFIATDCGAERFKGDLFGCFGVEEYFGIGGERRELVGLHFVN